MLAEARGRQADRQALPVETHRMTDGLVGTGARDQRRRRLAAQGLENAAQRRAGDRCGAESGEPSARAEEDFGDEAFTSLGMNVGDAVLYRGTNHRHGRIKPNPNQWSVHLFLHWVERDGRYADHAFDGQMSTNTNFQFA